jgi:hypothetical protein
MGMNCDEAGAMFSPARDGRLDGSELSAFGGHISSCENCRMEFARYNFIFDCARETEPVKAGTGFERALAERISRQTLVRPAPRYAVFTYAAAAVLFMVGALTAGYLLGRASSDGRISEISDRVNKIENTPKNQGVLPAVYSTRQSAAQGDILQYVDAANNALDDIAFAAKEEEHLKPADRDAIREQYVSWDFPEWSKTAGREIESFPGDVRPAAADDFTAASAALSDVHSRICDSPDWKASEIWRVVDNSGVLISLGNLRPVVLRFRGPMQQKGSFQVRFGAVGGTNPQMRINYMKPENISVIYNDGKQRIVLGDFSGAMRHFERVLVSDPDGALAECGLRWTIHIFSQEMDSEGGVVSPGEFDKRVNEWFGTLPDDVTGKLRVPLEKELRRVHDKEQR